MYLEARRLLVHTGRPVAAVAAELGFNEPTNFLKFVVRMSGGTPGPLAGLVLTRGRRPRRLTVQRRATPARSSP